MLQARFGQSPVTRAAQAEGAHGLRLGSLYAGTARVQRPSFLSAQALPGRTQRFVLYLRVKQKLAWIFFGFGAQRPGVASGAHVLWKLHEVIGLDLLVKVVVPSGRRYALGAMNHPLFPVDRELLIRIGPLDCMKASRTLELLFYMNSL